MTVVDEGATMHTMAHASETLTTTRTDAEATGLGLDFRHDAPDAYRALAGLTRASSLDHRLAELMKVRASQINRCAYCVDLHVDLAIRAGEDPRRLHAVAVWEESPFFSPRERAALALTEALTMMSDGGLSPDLRAEVARHFDRPERSRLVVVIAGINAWNRVMAAMGDQPPPLPDHGAEEGS